jgi:hypothetical protein
VVFFRSDFSAEFILNLGGMHKHQTGDSRCELSLIYLGTCLP